VVLGLDQPNRVEVDHRDVGAQIAGAQRNARLGADPTTRSRGRTATGPLSPERRTL
jgi:hypothetical protein